MARHRRYDIGDGRDIGGQQLLRQPARPRRRSQPPGVVAARLSSALDALPHRWPAALKDLLRECWRVEPSERPNFGSLVVRLEDLAHLAARRALGRAARQIDEPAPLDDVRKVARLLPRRPAKRS